MLKAVCSLSALVVLGVALTTSLQAAGQNITALTTTITTGAPSTVDGLTYDNTVQAVTGFADVLGVSYTAISSAPNAVTRRASTGTNHSPNQASVWYAYGNGGNGGNLAGVNQTNYPAMPKSNNALEGADNVFSNGTGASNANIERLDYTWNSPLTSNNQLAFAVFDRGVAAQHDAFTIAVITGSSQNGTPVYGAAARVAGDWGGTTNLLGNPVNQLLRYNNGDTLTSLTNRNTLTNDQNTQGIGGIVLRTSELGVADGATVYGYSLMGADVVITNLAALSDVSDTSVYPANTADANGGIDLVALNGIAFRAAVPEPSAFLVADIGLGLVVTTFARRRRS